VDELNIRNAWAWPKAVKVLMSPNIKSDLLCKW